MDEIPRKLYERTGRHYCIRCLKEVSAEEYFRNDFVCEACGPEAQSSNVPGSKEGDPDSAKIDPL